jgi:hypothetical protein
VRVLVAVRVFGDAAIVVGDIFVIFAVILVIDLAVVLMVVIHLPGALMKYCVAA